MAKDFSARDSVDVLIAGAGAAGLALALDLARRGLRFRLIEKRDAPFQGSRGKGLQPRTLEVFEDLGIVDRIFAAGGPYPPQREYRPDGSFLDSAVVEPQVPTPAEPYTMPLMVPQFLTEEVMRARLRELGHQPQFGQELVGLAQDDIGVTVEIQGLRGIETLRTRYLIGADGGRSFVRKALGIDFPGKTLGVRGLVADLALTGLGRDVWHRFNANDKNAQMMLCPLAGTDLFQLQAPIPREGAFDLSVPALAALISERTGRSDIAVHSVSWASAYTMNARLADQYRVGRVFLIGDAAHIHPPTGGQGLNTSVQDAYNLGWKLAAVIGGAPERLLDTYAEERRPVAASMLGLSTALLDAARRGELRRGRETRQLDLGYSGSSLAREPAGRAGALHAGDRAPDAPIRGAGGRSTRLFDLLQGPHWTLLISHAGRDAPAPRPGMRIHSFGPQGDLKDEAGHFRDAYAPASGDWFLIRPDGYVGAIIPVYQRAALEEYLHAVGLRAPAEAYT